MSPEQQQIAIAKACGWTGTEEDYTYYGFTQNIPMTRTRWTNPSGGQTTLTLPDYLNDLNACHEMEKVLDYNQLREMEDSVSFQFAVYPFHATASQRAEAFLRTLGLWKENPTQPQ